MVTEFKFPDVGEGVTEGTLLTWLVEEGDEVEEDESLAEVETDKAVVEIPSPVAATVLKLHAAEGDTIKVGNVIVTLGDEGETADAAADDTAEEADGSEDAPESRDTEESAEPEDDAADEPSGGSTSVVGVLEDADTKPVAAGGTAMATPATRRLARENGVDINAIDGSGPGGRITRDDVLRAAGNKEEPAENGEQHDASRVLATPATRRLAKELDIDITTVEGSGPGGRVMDADVRAAADGGDAAETEDEPDAGGTRAEPETSVGVTGGFGTPARFPPKQYDFAQYGAVERVDLSGTRKAIGRNMERSKYTAPHVTSMDDADVTDLWDVRKKEKRVAEDRGIHLTFLPFIVKAVISGLRDYPMMNASFDETTGELVKKQYYNIGVAVATDRGLLVPVVKNAGQKSILRIAKEIQEMAEKARNKEITLQDMQGGSFTITNYGSIGGRYGTPIINYPEVAILGTGTIREEPVVRDGDIVKRRMLPLSVTFDHRVVDGAYVAHFMNEVIKHLEDPDLLLLDE